MAIGTITVTAKSQVSGLNLDRISFAGDGAYSAGGTPGFQALVRAALGKGNVTLLAVTAEASGGYMVQYDTTNDKLKIYQGDNDNSADAPAIENATANLSGVTFKLLAISK
jgi:hypothetical protein